MASKPTQCECGAQLVQPQKGVRRWCPACAYQRRLAVMRRQWRGRQSRQKPTHCDCGASLIQPSVGRPRQQCPPCAARKNTADKRALYQRERLQRLAYARARYVAQRDRLLAYQRAYQQTARGREVQRAAHRRFFASAKGRAALRYHDRTTKGKARHQRYLQTLKGRLMTAKCNWRQRFGGPLPDDVLPFIEAAVRLRLAFDIRGSRAERFI